MKVEKKNQYKQNEELKWQGWPLAPRPSDWLDRHTGTLLGIIIIIASIFCFICGVVVGKVQPTIYRWVLQVIGLG